MYTPQAESAGMKRSLPSEVHGPPNKVVRPELFHHYPHPSQYAPPYPRPRPPPPQHMQQNMRNDMDPSQHGHYMPGQSGHMPPHDGYSNPHPPPHPPYPGEAPPMNSYSSSYNHHSYHGYQHPSYPPRPRRYHPNMSPANPASVYSNGHAEVPSSNRGWPQMNGPVDMYKSHRYRSMLASDTTAKPGPTPDSVVPFPSEAKHSPMMRLPQSYPPPQPNMSHINRSQNPYQPHSRPKPPPDPNSFPPGCVEATLPRLPRMRVKTGKDIGMIGAWRIVMALKSGLLAESTWALNALTVLLHDQKTVGQIVLSQLPGLLHSIVSHYRCCLDEMFFLPEEPDICHVTEEHSSELIEREERLFRVVDRCQEHFRTKCEKEKFMDASCNLQSPFSRKPVKLRYANDANVMDKSVLWERSRLELFLDEVAHIVPSFGDNPSSNNVTHSKLSSSTRKEDARESVAEVTMEDILSVPSYVQDADVEDKQVKEQDSKTDEEDAPAKEEEKKPLEAEEKELDEGKSGSKIEENTDDKEKSVDVVKQEDEEKPENDVKPENDEKLENEETTNNSPKTASKAANQNEHQESDTKTFEKGDETQKSSYLSDSHIQSCLERFSQNCNVVLLDDESAGFPGDDNVEVTRLRKYVGGNKGRSLRQEEEYERMSLMQKVLCLSNLIRSLSCSSINHSELCRHEGLIRILARTLLLRHKHRIRFNATVRDTEEAEEDATNSTQEDASSNEADEPKEDEAPPEPSEPSQPEETINESPAKTQEACDDEEREKVKETLKNSRLENGLNNINKDSKSNEKISPTIDRRKTPTGKSLQAKKKNIDDLCQRLRFCQNSDGTNISVLRNDDSSKPENLVNNEQKLSSMENNLNAFIRPKYLENTLFCDFKSDSVSGDETQSEGSKTENASSKSSKKKCKKYSSIVLDYNDVNAETKKMYDNAWWWECAQQVREDSFVTLANLSMYIDLSSWPDDESTLVLLDSCLHWAVCPSAEARDAMPTMGPKAKLSSQHLVIEILTKLSMKEENVNLILATRPYRRLERLFENLVTMVGSHKDQTLREFSIVLLSNFSNAEETIARSIALQKGAVSNLIGFLEECEETGLNNRRMFLAGQERVNCGTVPYMMQKCAATLLRLARVPENKSLFLKHQLRLLSLSMSSLLDGIVLGLLSSTLYELSKDPVSSIDKDTHDET